VDKSTFGLRNEYGVVFSADGQRQLSSQEVGRRLFGSVMSGGLGRAVLLRNGARLRLDNAVSHPEYATPECGSVPDLVVHDKAGERILEGLLADASQRLHEEGIAGDIHVFKTNVGPAGSSSSCQENYLVGLRGEFGRLADILIPFLITRQLICGAGTVAQTPHGAVYCLSRRTGHIGNGPSSAASRSRPLISTRMAEAGTVLPDLTLDNPVQALGEVSRDITGRCRVRLANGREMSVLDIQLEYLAKARDFTDKHGADALSRRVLALWERVLNAIGTGDLGTIAREIDWVIKYQLIEQYRAAHDLPLSAPQVAQADLAYHDIHRGRGLYYQLQRSGAVERTARDIDIFEAKTVPPAPGRYRQAG
jgi:proteasome accessory factor A